MSMIKFAEDELDRIGMTEGEEGDMNTEMRRHILHMINEFAKAGHSGFSASYALSILKSLLAYKPLSPLTGKEDEWIVQSEASGEPCWQNIRCSHVFKGADGIAYDIYGKIFTEHYIDENGEEQTSSFSSISSRVNVTFPYTPKSEYVDVGFRKEDNGILE